MSRRHPTAGPDDTTTEGIDLEGDPVVLPIEDSIDLHHFHPSEILEVVDAYLDAVLERGFREVRLIHGRGKGVQRARVQRLLETDARVASFFDAPPGRGGWGATVVQLAPAGPPDRADPSSGQ
jgi:dsDNA-specific endonuclease/ATPase MutS2